MKTAIRMFALLVAITGLVSTSIAPAANRTLAMHRSMLVGGPVPEPQLPLPLPCSLNGTCFAPSVQPGN